MAAGILARRTLKEGCAMKPTNLNGDKLLPVKKPYQRPILVVHGDLRQITAFKNSNMTDGVINNTKQGS